MKVGAGGTAHFLLHASIMIRMNKDHPSVDFAHESANYLLVNLIMYPEHAFKKFRQCLHWAKEAWLLRHGTTPDFGDGWWSLDAQFERIAGHTAFAQQLARIEIELEEWISAKALIPESSRAAVDAAKRLVALLSEHIPRSESSAAPLPQPPCEKRSALPDGKDHHPPSAEISVARLGHSLAFQTIHAEPPWQIARLIPAFPEVRPDIEENTDIVWDLSQLCESIRKPGGYHVLNCTCGISDHAGLDGLAFIAHPDDETVIWELDIPDHSPALHERWGGDSGFLRLVFNRAEYEADIRAMLAAVLVAGSTELPVEEYAPNNHNGEAYEWLQSLAAADDWSRQPVFPPGAVLEFQPGQLDTLLDGKPLRQYMPRLFTRWSVAQAYHRWTRLFWRGGQCRIDDPAACDAAGREFVTALRESFAEGRTAPGVSIRYRQE